MKKIITDINELLALLEFNHDIYHIDYGDAYKLDKKFLYRKPLSDILELLKSQKLFYF